MVKATHPVRTVLPRRRRLLGAWLAPLAVTAGLGAAAQAQVTLIERHNTGIGLNLIGIAHDPDAGQLYVYRHVQAVIRVLTTDGVQIATLPRPGVASSDFDLNFASEPVDFGSAIVPAGTLLVVNGYDNPNRVYALDPLTGAVLASQSIPNSGFGGPFTAVGGSYHPGRNTFFASDYRQNAVAEVNLATGTIVASFIVPGGFDTFYGDVDVNPTTGNLLLVSDKHRFIREVTPTGQFVQDIDLTAFVGINNNGMSGISFDPATGEAWLTIRWGEVVHLADVSQPAPLNLTPICAIAEPPPSPCDGATAAIPLDGSMSLDTDPGDMLSFAWTTTCPGGAFDDPAAAAPLLTVDTTHGCNTACDVQLVVTDLAGATSTCGAAVAIFDDAPPVLVLETTEIVVVDSACNGIFEVELPEGLAADACDPAPVVKNDADSQVMAAGGQAVITYTATDSCGNATAGGPDNQVTITVQYGSTIELWAVLRVFEGHHSGQPQPLAGVEFAAYDRSRESCARNQRTGKRITDEDYPAILANCAHEVMAKGVTDDKGHLLLDVPPGRYVVIGQAQYEGETHLLGGMIGGIRCGETRDRRLPLTIHLPPKPEPKPKPHPKPEPTPNTSPGKDQGDHGGGGGKGEKGGNGGSKAGDSGGPAAGKH
jgi:hypothetical protein